MTVALTAGLLLAGLGFSGVLVSRVMGPAGMTRAMTGIAVVTGIASISGTLMVATVGLPKLHDLVDRIGWCPTPHPDEHAVPIQVAAIATALLAVSLFRGYRYLQAMHRHHTAFAGINGVQIIVTDEPIAIAVPGRPGGVVIGSKLMRNLNPEEKAALLAHEQAHLRLNHHRYVHATGLIAAMFPPLAPLARRVRYMTERWADETAAQEIGSRTILAQTIAKVALMSPSALPTPALTFTGTGTRSRVAALMKSQTGNQLTVTAAVVTTGAMTVLLGVSLKAHHLTELISYLCHP